MYYFCSRHSVVSWEGHECKLGNVAADPGGNCQVRSSRSTGSQIHTPNTMHSPYLPLQITHFSSSQIHIQLQCTRPVKPSECTAHKYNSSVLSLYPSVHLYITADEHPSPAYWTHIQVNCIAQISQYTIDNSWHTPQTTKHSPQISP